MNDNVVLLSIPGLRQSDLAQMPRLSELVKSGDRAFMAPSFPAVTCPVQVNMTTGLPPSEHGIIANGFYHRNRQEVEMWTAWNSSVERPQLWDQLREHDAALTSAVWFPLLAKGCGADYICMPAPIHNPDGSESLWCYTKPEAMYGELRDELGHFPLQHFWGPIANIQSSAWIVSSAIWAAERHKPNLFYIYLPHLDYAAQRDGPDSPAAIEATKALDAEIGRLVDGFANAYAARHQLWLVASEYVIAPVNDVTYPNRILRDAGLLQTKPCPEGGELIDFEESRAWAMVDHQLSNVFVRDAHAETIGQVVDLFRGRKGFAEVLAADEQQKYEINHANTGEVVIVSPPESWQAYYYWQDDAQAPPFARTVDIHQKPGFDPVELFFDPTTRGIPLDATLVKGSHGAPARHESQRGVVLSSEKGVFIERTLADIDVAEIVLQQFGV